MNYNDLYNALLRMPKGPAPIEMIVIAPDDFDLIVHGLTDQGAVIIPFTIEYDPDGNPIDMVDDGWRYMIVDFVDGIAFETKLTVIDECQPGQAIIMDKSAPLFNWQKPAIKLEHDWQSASICYGYGLWSK